MSEGEDRNGNLPASATAPAAAAHASTPLTFADDDSEPEPLELQVWDQWLLSARDGLVRLAVKLLGDTAVSNRNAVLIDTQFTHTLENPRFAITRVTLVSRDWLRSHRPNAYDMVTRMGVQQRQQQQPGAGAGAGADPILAVLLLTWDRSSGSAAGPPPPLLPPDPPALPVDSISRLSIFQLSPATLTKLLADPTSVEHWVNVVNSLT